MTMKVLKVKAPTWMELKNIISHSLEIPEEQASYLIWKSNIEIEFLRYVTHNLQIDYDGLFQYFIEYDGGKYKSKYMKILEDRKATGKPFRVKKKQV